VRTNEADLSEGDWVPEPLALFMQRETVDKVLERNYEEDADDQHVNAVSDTPSVIRAGIHHRYSFLFLWMTDNPPVRRFFEEFCERYDAKIDIGKYVPQRRQGENPRRKI
jgi:hypothetical protein